MEIYRKDIPVVAPEFRVSQSDDTIQPHYGLGMKYTAAAVFDPSADTTKRPTGEYGLGVYIPDNAIITKAWYDVVTTFTSAGADAGTIALSVQSANDIVSAIAISDATNVWDAGIRGSKIGFPSFGADTAHDTQVEVAALFAATYLKTTARRQLTATVATQALTAGKLVLFVEYVISA